jgi:hypothetical protein
VIAKLGPYLVHFALLRSEDLRVTNPPEDLVVVVEDEGIVVETTGALKLVFFAEEDFVLDFRVDGVGGHDEDKSGLLVTDFPEDYAFAVAVGQ